MVCSAESMTVGQLAERIDAVLAGDGSAVIGAVKPLETAGAADVTFLSGAAKKEAAAKSAAAAFIVPERIDRLDRPQLVVANVDAALINALRILAPRLAAPPAGIDKSARVAGSASIDPGASIGPWAVVGDSVRVGAGTVIAAGCKIGQNSVVGSHCRLDCNVVVYHNCTVGNNVVIQAQTVVGSTGFGYSFIDGSHRLVPHNGSVVIEDFVEIGANCCIDRAKFGDTIIGAGTKIDNLVQIAHNVVIGKCCLIAALVGIAGSCRIGDGVVIGGQAGLRDHIEIGSKTQIGAQSGVTRSFPPDSFIMGAPAEEMADFKDRVVSLRRVPKMAAQLKQLGQRIDKLETAEDDSC
jgi:UDP-3-O-[3-hydroxymyristoyl] glucosamine N-acyltransferase